MAEFSTPSVPTYPGGITKWQTNTQAQGGAENSPMNSPLKQLADRTHYLKTNLDLVQQGTGINDGAIAAAKLAPSVLPTGSRNCILSGPIDSAGNSTVIVPVNNQFVAVNGNPTPIQLTFMYGFENGKQVDFSGVLSSDVQVDISSLAGTTPAFVFIERNVSSGVLTAKSDIITNFILGPIAPTTNRKYWFDSINMVWNEWTTVGGGSWVKRQIVIIGKVMRSIGGTVTDVLPYSFHDSFNASTGIEPGTIVQMYRAENNPPLGYLACNGATVSKVQYGRLYEALGISVAGSSFNLPNIAGSNTYYTRQLHSFIKY